MFLNNKNKTKKTPPPIQTVVLRIISRNFQDAEELTAQVKDIKVFSNRFLCELLLRNKEVPWANAARIKLRAKQQMEWPQRATEAHREVRSK